jgi:hypothetical protein
MARGNGEAIREILWMVAVRRIRYSFAIMAPLFDLEKRVATRGIRGKKGTSLSSISLLTTCKLPPTSHRLIDQAA